MPALGPSSYRSSNFLQDLEFWEKFESNLLACQDAAFCGGIILSNDNYRDIVNESREMKTAIEERLLNFNFRKDTLHVPQDPVGRNGPKLDKFLEF